MIKKVNYSVCLMVSLASSCAASDNMVAFGATEHQQEADKKAAADWAKSVTTPRFHIHSLISGWITDVIGTHNIVNGKRVDHDEMPNLIYDYYYEEENDNEKAQQPLKGIIYFDREQPTDAYTIITGVGKSVRLTNLDMPLDTDDVIKEFDDSCWVRNSHRDKVWLYSYFSSFGRQASDYATGYVGDDAERKRVSAEQMAKHVPRVLGVLKVATNILHRSITSYYIDCYRSYYLSKALVDCAAHYPHKDLLENLLSLGARASGTAFTNVKVDEESYADAALPKDLPDRESLSSWLFEQAQREAIKYKKWWRDVEEEIRSRAQQSDGTIKDFVQRAGPHDTGYREWHADLIQEDGCRTS